MPVYRFTSISRKSFKKLDKKTQFLIIRKLDFYCKTPNLIVFAKPIKKHKAGKYRFRIGDYRVIFDVEEDDLIILEVGHRREIYKR